MKAGQSGLEAGVGFASDRPHVFFCRYRLAPDPALLPAVLLRPALQALLELVQLETERAARAFLRLVASRRAEELWRVVLPALEEPDAEHEAREQILGLEIVHLLREERAERPIALRHQLEPGREPVRAGLLEPVLEAVGAGLRVLPLADRPGHPRAREEPGQVDPDALVEGPLLRADPEVPAHERADHHAHGGVDASERVVGPDHERPAD